MGRGSLAPDRASQESADSTSLEGLEGVDRMSVTDRSGKHQDNREHVASTKLKYLMKRRRHAKLSSLRKMLIKGRSFYVNKYGKFCRQI